MTKINLFYGDKFECFTIYSMNCAKNSMKNKWLPNYIYLYLVYPKSKLLTTLILLTL